MKVLILILLTITSCTKWHDVKEGNGILYIEKAVSEVHSLKDVEWKVGQSRDKTISKGFVFKFDIPKVDSDGAQKLFNKYGITSWIFRIKKITRGNSQILGHVTYDLSNITRVSSDITIHIFYHAAAVSQTFRKFHCPAFNHRYQLNNFSIKNTNPKEYDIFSLRGQAVHGRIEKPSFAPVIFSGDTSLFGQYIVEYALFNKKEKKIFSKWYRANNIVEVQTEDRVILPSCSGIKEENDIENLRPPKPSEFRIN